MYDPSKYETFPHLTNIVNLAVLHIKSSPPCEFSALKKIVSYSYILNSVLNANYLLMRNLIHVFLDLGRYHVQNITEMSVLNSSGKIPKHTVTVICGGRYIV